jgi:hypothetical protein
MAAKTIVEFSAPEAYHDHYVSHGRMAFSFLSKDGQMVGPFVDCRGYIIERLQGFLHKFQGSTIYKYHPKQMGAIDLDKTRLVVSKKGITLEKFEAELKLTMDLVHQVEKALHLLPSKYERVTGVSKEYGFTFLIVGSKRWMLSSVMLSLYLFLLRNGYRHKKSQKWQTTLNHLDNDDGPDGEIAIRGIEHIIANRYIKVFGDDMDYNYRKEVMSHIHHMGIAIFSSEVPSYIQQYQKLWSDWIWPISKPKAATKVA